MPSNVGGGGESLALWLPLLETGGKSIASRLLFPREEKGAFLERGGEGFALCLPLLGRRREHCPVASSGEEERALPTAFLFP